METRPEAKMSGIIMLPSEHGIGLEPGHPLPLKLVVMTAIQHEASVRQEPMTICRKAL